MLIEEIASSLNCNEVDSLAAILKSYGEASASGLWLQVHSLSDERGDVHFGLPTPDLTPE